MSQIPDYMLDMNAVLHDNTQWLSGSPPDYSKVNELYTKGRTFKFEAGSLEDLVSNLVKNWEKEASHKISLGEWRTIDRNKFKMNVNGGKWFTGEELQKLGTYNLLIGDSEHYCSSLVGTAEKSHRIFRDCFKDGFAWECLEVYSGPPRCCFKWRHWGKMTGCIRCPMRNGSDFFALPQNRQIEIFGIAIATLSEDYKIESLEIFFDPNDLFKRIDNQIEKKE